MKPGGPGFPLGPSGPTGPYRRIKRMILFFSSNQTFRLVNEDRPLLA